VSSIDAPGHGGTVPEVVAADVVHGVRRETWRFTGSEGDDVMADAWLSSRPGPGPVVVAGHGASADRTVQEIRGAGLAWAPQGVTVVAADAPLHGDRAAVAGEVPGHDVWQLSLVQRTVKDLCLLCDAAQSRFGKDHPLAYLGLSMGSVYGVAFMTVEERLQAGVFAICGSTRVAAAEKTLSPEYAEALGQIDPVDHAGGISPRPVLMVNADEDEVFSRNAAFALYDAFGHPKEITFYPGLHSEWRAPAQWHWRMRTFLARVLET
jgi:cephalosporin-C deacetylase-like acetyl esterase